MAEQYQWTDNPTESGVALCDTDVLNDCLMYLKDGLDQVTIEADNFLPKSGGTMTGILHIGVNKQYADDIIIDSKTIDVNSTTSVASNDGIHFYDKNGNLGCYLIWRQLENSKDNGLAIGYNATTNPNFLGFNFPKATTKATTTSSASTYKPAVVVQNYVNGISWYRVWSDGWIEQGGSWYGAGTVSLLKNFSNTNYSITYGITSPGNSANTVYISDKAANQFTIAQFNGNGGAGNWHACGY